MARFGRADRREKRKPPEASMIWHTIPLDFVLTRHCLSLELREEGLWPAGEPTWSRTRIRLFSDTPSVFPSRRGGAGAFTEAFMAVFNGTPGDDTLDGAGDNDVINGLAGNDTLNGGAGDDVLNGGEGADALNGGDGFDIIDYSDAASAIQAGVSGPSQQPRRRGGRHLYGHRGHHRNGVQRCPQRQ